MKPVKLLAVSLLGISMLSGCSTMQQQEGMHASKAPVGAKKEIELNLPSVELTPDILNDLLLAEIALQRNRFDTAIETLHFLAKETKDPRIAERATRIAMIARDYQTAGDTARLWVEFAPESIEARQFLTILMVKSGDQEAALNALEEVLASNREMDENVRYLTIIRLLGREQNKDVAMEVIGRFLERHPGDPSALFAYAQMGLTAGRLNDAEEAVDELLQIRPKWTQAIILKTKLMQASSREDEALKFMADVVARQSKENDLRIAYGRMLVDASSTDSSYLKEALNQFKQVLKLEPDNEDIMFFAGIVSLELGEFDDSEKYLLKLNRRSVRLEETSYYLGRIEEERENYERAIRWYDTVGRGETYFSSHIRSALLKARLGDVDGARAHLGTVQARNPGQRLRIFLAEGEILRDVELYQDAYDVYTRALEEVPGNSELLYARAMVAEKLDNLSGLEEDLLAILEREPDHVDALNSLGYTLADRTDRYEEALTYIERANELRPNVAYILDSLGWVHFRLGNLDQAREFLHRALALEQDAEIAAHLGEVLWVQGNREEARNVWNRALELTPDSAIILKAIERLEK